MMTPKSFLQSENGSIVSVLIISVVIITMSVYLSGMYLSNSQKEKQHLANIEAQQSTVEKFRNLLQNDFVINYSLANCASPDNSSALKACILTGKPSANSNCKNVQFNLCEPSGTTFESYAVNSAKPTSVDVFGNICDSSAANNNCMFDVNITCGFTCPGSPAAQECGLVKVISCEVVVVHTNASKLHFIQLSNKSSAYIPSYSIRLSNDLSSFAAVK